MDRNELLDIFDREQRRDVEIPGAHREASERVVRFIESQERTGFIAYSKLDESNVDAEIEAQVAYFSAQGIPFEWKVYDHDRPADLRQRLAARGFAIEDSEALMVIDLANAPDFYWTMDISCVSPLTRPEEIDALVAMEDEIWQSDHSDLGKRLARDLRETPELLSLFGVWDQERLVSAAWVYYHPPTQFASLWGGSTLALYRRRGYYTALLAARAREARQRGYRFLTVDASPMSRPILEKHGFGFYGYSTPCKWRGGADG